MPQQKNKRVILVESASAADKDRPSGFILDLNKIYSSNFPEKKADEAPLGKNKKETKKDRSEFFLDIGEKAKNLTFFPLLLISYKITKFLLRTLYYVGWFFVFLIKLPFNFLFKILGIFNFKHLENEESEDRDIYKIFNNKVTKESKSAKLKKRIRKIICLIPARYYLLIFFVKLRQILKLRVALRLNLKLFFARLKFSTKKDRKKFELNNILPKKSKSASSIVYVFFVMLVLVLPFKAFTSYLDLKDLKGKVLGISEAAFENIKDGTHSAGEKDFIQANKKFADASENFFNAEKEIREVAGLLSIIAPVIPSKDVKMAAQADLILEAGRQSAKIAEDLSLIVGNLNSGEIKTDKLLKDFCVYSQSLEKDVTNLSDLIRRIDSDNLPAEYKEKFEALQEKVDLIDATAGELSELARSLELFLGIDYDKRYLLVFQNNAEMRASGGFIGSYALADFSGGSLKNLEVPGGGSYDTEWGMLDKVIAPEALSIVNPRWYFWDANWWPDWPTTAKKLEWFYEQSEKRTVDGVISLTPTVLEKILEIIGPIDMQEKYGLTFDSKNFWDLTQDLSESKTLFATSSAASASQIQNKEPKKIIGDLAEKIKEELPKRLTKEMFFDLLEVFSLSIEEKHILLYFNDPVLEKKAADYGADGKMSETKWDYLMVVDTNVAGQKSDRKINEEIRHTAEIQEDGSIIDTLIIKRTHTALKNEKFVGFRNNDWMRIYVPLGSELISSDGWSRPEDIYFSKPGQDWDSDPDVLRTEGKSFIKTESGTKVYEESGKTVFANWSQADPGETIVIYLKYKLPFKVEIVDEKVSLYDNITRYFNPDQKELIPYALMAQKQPGSVNSELLSELKVPDNFKKVWVLNNGYGTGWNYKGKFLTDKYFAILLSQ